MSIVSAREQRQRKRERENISKQEKTVALFTLRVRSSLFVSQTNLLVHCAKENRDRDMMLMIWWMFVSWMSPGLMVKWRHHTWSVCSLSHSAARKVTCVYLNHAVNLEMCISLDWWCLVYGTLCTEYTHFTRTCCVACCTRRISQQLHTHTHAGNKQRIDICSFLSFALRCTPTQHSLT